MSALLNGEGTLAEMDNLMANATKVKPFHWCSDAGLFSGLQPAQWCEKAACNCVKAAIEMLTCQGTKGR